jgi:hypothetical protein
VRAAAERAAARHGLVCAVAAATVPARLGPYLSDNPPFLDGNGRVARLMSHALLLDIGIGSALWSASRGLARNSGDYKPLLMAADEPRRNELDGRGA